MTSTIIREHRGAVKPDPRAIAAYLRTETGLAWRMTRYYRRCRDAAMRAGDLEAANRYEKWRLVDRELFLQFRRIVRLARMEAKR